jgi:FixJ family two-component response regulator
MASEGRPQASGLADVMPAPVVYIVDDDTDVRRSIQRLLLSVGLVSETFATADDFLQHVDRDRLGCVVMDVRMPRVSGLDAQRRLAESGVEIPLIFVTGHADISAVVRAMKAGAVEVFGKPFDHQAFIDAVHRAIDRDRRRREERRTLDVLRSRFESLSAREREVMALVVTGKLNKVVAAELGTTEKTVKAQRAQVMRKMEALSLPDLVRMADRLSGMAPPRPVGH